jgi:hypothetical protein
MPFWTLRCDVRVSYACVCAAGHFIYLIRQREVLPMMQCYRSAPPFPTPPYPTLPYPVYLMCDDITSFSFFWPLLQTRLMVKTKPAAPKSCVGVYKHIEFNRHSFVRLRYFVLPNYMSKFHEDLCVELVLRKNFVLSPHWGSVSSYTKWIRVLFGKRKWNWADSAYSILLDVFSPFLFFYFVSKR